MEPPHLFGDPASQPPGPRVVAPPQFPEQPCGVGTFSAGGGPASRTLPPNLGIRDSGRLCPAVGAAPPGAPGSTPSSCPICPRDSTFLAIGELVCKMGIRAVPPSGANLSLSQEHRWHLDIGSVRRAGSAAAVSISKRSASGQGAGAGAGDIVLWISLRSVALLETEDFRPLLPLPAPRRGWG